MIELLKKFHTTIASNEKEKIAGIFQFPLPSPTYSIFIDDNSYYDQLKANDNKTTKVMFLEHYKEIYSAIWMEQVDNLLQNIKVDSLLLQDSLVFDAYLATKPCFYSYSIEVDKDYVALRMSIKSNVNYESKKNTEEEIAENSSEICEHSFWWIFRFDGQRLELKSISGAG